MIRRGLRFVCFFFILAIPFFASAQRKERRKKESPATPAPVISYQDSQRYTECFIRGLGEKTLGNMDKAVDYFNQSLAINPVNDAAYYELALAKLVDHKNEDATFLVKRAIGLDPNQSWYLSLLVNIDEQRENYPELIVLYKKLQKLDPDKITNYLGAAHAYTKMARFKEAIAMYDSVEVITGQREEMELQKQKIYLQNGQTNEAMESMQSLIDEHPEEPRNYLMMSEIYKAAKMDGKVSEMIQKAISIDPYNGFSQLALSDYYGERGEKGKSFEALKKAFASDNIEFDQKKKILEDRYVFKPASDQREGLTLSKMLADAYPEESEAQNRYASFVSETANPASPKGREDLLTAVKANKEDYELWSSLIIADFNAKDYKAAVAHATEALTYFPNQVTLYWYKGLANAQIGAYDQSVKSLKEGLSLTSGQRDLEAQLYQALGETYHSQKKYAASDSAYQMALSRKPDDPGILNNFAYFLSLRNHWLDKAEQMAKKAVAIEPGNASYEDTYAWVLFHSGKYKEALGWIERAMGHDPSQQRATFLEHRGDILFKLGETAQAVVYWKKAKSSGSKNTVLDKEILDRKLYE